MSSCKCQLYCGRKCCFCHLRHPVSFIFIHSRQQLPAFGHAGEMYFEQTSNELFIWNDYLNDWVGYGPNEIIYEPITRKE